MNWDLCKLVRRDHDDLDLAVVALASTATPIDELSSLLDVARLALTVHIAAETRVLDMLMRGALPANLALVVELTRHEHKAQQAAAAELMEVPPGREEWYSRALDFRILILDHATRADLMRWSLDDHVSTRQQRSLAAEYATERMRAFGRTSPIAFAREVTARDRTVALRPEKPPAVSEPAAS